MIEAAYGKTPMGQLMYDLAFTDMSSKYLARKHRMTAKQINHWRQSTSVAALRKKVRSEGMMKPKRKSAR